MSAKDLIDGAVEHLRTSASVKTVYGEPIVAEGKTVIPVAKVAYGFGGGSGTGKPGKNGNGTTPEGESAGGGVAAKPVGVVEITGQETKFVQFGQPKKLAVTAFIGAGIGLGLGWLLGRKAGKS
jgi:uncharacterized spore protein YtfJ